MKYFGGIEGGATHSRLVICNEAGECLATTTGLSTNHWLIGIVEVSYRIADMVERAKEEANIPKETRLTCLGLSLSGCEQEATNRDLERELRTVFPNIAEQYVVCSDTMGSVFTASQIGGMVVISGTGSNALLVNPDGTTYNCGGWGNFLGDEGSAWHIAHRAVKIVFDDMDNFEKSPYSVESTWQLIKEHFNVQTRLDLLPHCYAKFDKPFYAHLCKKLAKAAEQGEPLAQHVFREAGTNIGRSINALLPKVQHDLVNNGYLNIVCVGSVWLSWSLLRDSLERELDRHPVDFSIRLVRITKSAAFGACYLAADHVKYNLPRNYEDNFTVMHVYNSKAKATTTTTTTKNGYIKASNGHTNGIETV